MKVKTFLLTLFFAGLIISGIAPHDYFTWMLEVFPAVAGLIILFLIRKKFEFTMLTYSAISIHCIILFIGGHYTYAEVPLFEWVKEAFHQTRNNYDKVGHFAQGFFPAFIIRELFIRKSIIQNKKWLPFLVVCVCLSISAAYEFFEWLVAEISGESAEAFLGTQGYVWDTQSDMLYATVGSIMMILFFSTAQNKAIGRLAGK